MRLLIDGTPLLRGGGLQVASAFLTKIQGSTVDWSAVLPSEARTYFESAIGRDPRCVYLDKIGLLNKLILNHQLAKLERKVRPTIVYTVFGPPYFRATTPHVSGFAIPRILYGDPTATRLRQVNNFFADRLRLRALDRLSAIIVETESAAAALKELLDASSNNVIVIPNGPSSLLEGSGVGRGHLKPISSPFRVLVPTAYYRHKNLELLPRIAHALAKSRGSDSFKIAVTLSASDANWGRILESSRNLGVLDSFSSLGQLGPTALAQEYLACDCVLLPTRLEISTAVYPESFFFERPLVTSDLPFARDLCGPAALYADPLNPSAFADHVASLMSDRALRCTLVDAGRNRLSATYLPAEKRFRLQMNLLEDISGSWRPLCR